MTRIKCGAVECKFNNNKNECTANSIVLNEGYYHTMNEGVKQIWTCKQYEQSDSAKRLEEAWRNYWLDRGKQNG